MQLKKVFIQGGSNMTGTDYKLFTHNQSRSYLNHLVLAWQVSRNIAYECIQFLVTFVKLRKAALGFVISVCPSVRMQQLGSHWTDLHEIW
jgi:hypothetical protein